jgi:dipeptidyl aminopeptidase/acylaminoacyl peptidase
VTGGPEIVPPSAGRWLYYWQIDLGLARGAAGDAAQPLQENNQSSIVRMPLQGSLVAENFWGPPSGKPCAGCHTVSPDGRFVALAEFGSTQAVKLVDKLTRTEVLLSHSLVDATFLAWNPDVTAGAGWQYVYSDGMDLHLASIGGGYAGKLVGADTPDRMESMPTWLPDGSIVFTRFEQPGGAGQIGGSGPAQLYRLAPGAATAELLMPQTGTATAARYYPRVSPDGRWIAYTESVGVNGGLGTISASDARIRLVSPDGRLHAALARPNGRGDGGSSYPTWSADGRYLSFASNRSGGQGSWDLYLAPIDPTTGDAEAAINLEALNTPNFEHAVQWSP